MKGSFQQWLALFFWIEALGFSKRAVGKKVLILKSRLDKRVEMKRI